MYYFCYVTTFGSGVVLDVFETGKSNIWKPVIQTSNLDIVKCLSILEALIGFTLLWSSPIFISFMISVTTIVLSREFDQCNANLKNNIKKHKYLTKRQCFETTDRFHELTSIVNKVDSIFSDLGALNIILSWDCYVVPSMH